MSMNMDAAIRIKANVLGANAIQAFSRDLKGLDGVAKLSGAELGRMNIAINRMAREAGNTTAGLRQHISALSNLRERVEIGGKAYNRLGGEIDALRGKLRALDKDAEKTGGTLKDQLIGGLATAGVGRMTAGIIGNASNLDAEVRKASAIEGGGNYAVLRKEIEAVAAVAAGTPTDVAKLATALSRAGFTAKETAASLRGIVLAAEASDVAFEEMGSIGADAMRAFGIDTSKTSQVMDILLKTANSSNQTVLDLGESLKYAAPIARSLGVNINDLSATMAILANNGIRGSEAGTALRTGLQRLQIAASGNADQLLDLTKGSKLLGEAMKILGADVLDAEGKLKPLDQVLITLKNNLAKMPVGVQAEVIKALFGDEAGGKLRAALNSSEADIRKMFATIRNSGGAVESTSEQMRGFSYTMKVLTGNIETVSNAIGDKFIAVLDPLAKVTIGVLDVLLKMPQPMKDIAAAAAAAGITALGLGLALKTIGGISALTGITVSIRGITTALVGAAGAAKAFTLALLANPIGLAVAGVVALTVAAYNLSEPFKEFVNSIPQRMGMFWDSLVNDGTYAVNQVKALWQNFSTWFNSLWQGIGQWFAGVWDNIKNFVKDALGRIGIDASWLAGVMAKVGNEIEYLWNQAFFQIAKNWKQTVANMVNNTNPLFFVLKKAGVADVGGALANAWYGDLPPAPKRRPVNTSNIIPPAATAGGDLTIPGGADGGADKTKKAADEAKKALDQYSGAVTKGTDVTRTLMERLQDVNLNMIGIGVNATDALGVQRLKAELTGAREYNEELRKIADLEKQRNEAVAKGISTKDLDARIAAAKDLAQALKDARSQEAGQAYTQGLIDLLPKEADYNRQIKEAALLLENKKKGIEGLTETQKLNLQIELLGLEAIALTKPALAEQIRLLREKAGALDALNQKQDMTFGQSIGAKLQAYYDSIKNIGSAIGDTMAKAFQGIEDRLTEFVTTGKASFKDLARSILADLARIAIRAAIIKPLLGVVGNLFPGLGLTASAKGNIFAQNGVVPFAKGGIVTRPTVFPFAKGIGLMGEAGPEAIIPLRRGRDGKLGVAGGGSSTVVNVSVDATGSQVQGDAGQGQQLGRVIAGAVQAELVRQKRPGGLLAA